MSDYFDSIAENKRYDWNVLRFKEIVEKISDRDHFTPTYVDNGISIISPKDFDSNEKIQFGKCKFITLEAHEKNRKKTDLEADDLVFTRIGAGLGKSCLVTKDMPEFSILHSAAMIRVQKEKVKPKYFLYYLKSELLQRQIGVEIQSIGVPDLGLDKINDFKILLPPSNQQKKIAKILTAIDKLIEKTQTLIDKHNAIKKGMMTDLFTRGINLTTDQLRPPVEQAPHLYKETELGWIPKDWDVDKVDNVLERIIDYRGKTPIKTESGIPLITAKNIRMGCIVPEPREYIAANAYDEWMTRGIPLAGDVLFTTEAPLANVAQIKSNDKTAFAQRVIILRCNNKMNNDFLKYSLMSNDVRIRIFRKGSGSTVEGIKQSQFRKLEITFPIKIKEQILINEMLNKIINYINKESKYLNKLLELKNGLMQDLLTGQVKVA